MGRRRFQALIGMEAWFFTRIDGVDQLKNATGLEFVWRASSSLSDEDSEIFAHVLESYCESLILLQYNIAPTLSRHEIDCCAP